MFKVLGSLGFSVEQLVDICYDLSVGLLALEVRPVVQVVALLVVGFLLDFQLLFALSNPYRLEDVCLVDVEVGWLATGRPGVIEGLSSRVE